MHPGPIVNDQSHWSYLFITQFAHQQGPGTGQTPPMHQREAISPLIGAHTEEIDAAATFGHSLGAITPILFAKCGIQLDLNCVDDYGVHHHGEF